MRQVLGKKKTKLVAEIIGYPVIIAYTSAKWEHFKAQAYYKPDKDTNEVVYVDYKKKKILGTHEELYGLK